MEPINELLQAAEAQKSVDQDTVPVHDLVFGAKRCQRFFVILSGGANGDSIHPKVSYKVGGPAQRCCSINVFGRGRPWFDYNSWWIGGMSCIGNTVAVGERRSYRDGNVSVVGSRVIPVRASAASRPQDIAVDLRDRSQSCDAHRFPGCDRSWK